MGQHSRVFDSQRPGSGEPVQVVDGMGHSFPGVSEVGPTFIEPPRVVPVEKHGRWRRWSRRKWTRVVHDFIDHDVAFQIEGIGGAEGGLAWVEPLISGEATQPVCHFPGVSEFDTTGTVECKAMTARDRKSGADNEV